MDEEKIDKIKEAGWRVIRKFNASTGKTMTRFDAVFKDGQHIMYGAGCDEDLPKAIASVMNHPRFNDEKEKLGEVK